MAKPPSIQLTVIGASDGSLAIRPTQTTIHLQLRCDDPGVFPGTLRVRRTRDGRSLGGLSLPIEGGEPLQRVELRIDPQRDDALGTWCFDYAPDDDRTTVSITPSTLTVTRATARDVERIEAERSAFQRDLDRLVARGAALGLEESVSVEAVRATIQPVLDGLNARLREAQELDRRLSEEAALALKGEQELRKSIASRTAMVDEVQRRISIMRKPTAYAAHDAPRGTLAPQQTLISIDAPDATEAHHGDPLATCSKLTVWAKHAQQRAGASGVTATARAIFGAMQAEIRYDEGFVAGQSAGYRNALGVFATRSGVCGEHAIFFLVCMRTLGFPAWYARVHVEDSGCPTGPGLPIGHACGAFQAEDGRTVLVDPAQKKFDAQHQVALLDDLQLRAHFEALNRAH